MIQTSKINPNFQSRTEIKLENGTPTRTCSSDDKAIEQVQDKEYFTLPISYYKSCVNSRKFCLQITMTISLGMKITITMVVAMHHKCPGVEEVEVYHQ